MRHIEECNELISLEGSKSILNRVLIIVSMLRSPLKIFNYSSCNDIKTMQANLQKLGFDFLVKDEFVEISSSQNLKTDAQLYVQDSATAFRFLMARMAAWPGMHTSIEISSQLQNRPHQLLIDLLKKLGAEIHIHENHFEIEGRRLTGGEFDLDSSVSSQYISAMLLIAPLYKNDLVIHLKGKEVSRDYVEMTIEVMKNFGIEVQYSASRLHVAAGQNYTAIGSFTIEPDLSSACYFWTYGALSKNYICTQYLQNSIQPDHDFVRILQLIGADICIEDSQICIKKGQLYGIEVDMSNMPDQVPTLAVLALFADAPTIIHNIEHLKHKESNRLQAIKTEFSKLGIEVELTGDSIKIFPLKTWKHSVILDTYNDHRLVMAFSILQLIIPSISLKDTDAVRKSNPDFYYLINLIS